MAILESRCFSAPFLINQKGRYKGYPFRSFTGGRFTNGYSDHFPVYAYVIRQPKSKTETRLSARLPGWEKVFRLKSG